MGILLKHIILNVIIQNMYYCGILLKRILLGFYYNIYYCWYFIKAYTMGILLKPYTVGILIKRILMWGFY